jgi:hypothetical protein
MGGFIEGSMSNESLSEFWSECWSEFVEWLDVWLCVLMYTLDKGDRRDEIGRGGGGGGGGKRKSAYCVDLFTSTEPAVG